MDYNEIHKEIQTPFVLLLPSLKIPIIHRIRLILYFILCHQELDNLNAKLTQSFSSSQLVLSLAF
jgi:hypothetical protein